MQKTNGKPKQAETAAGAASNPANKLLQTSGEASFYCSTSK
jgi:hypothetical protein